MNSEDPTMSAKNSQKSFKQRRTFSETCHFVCVCVCVCSHLSVIWCCYNRSIFFWVPSWICLLFMDKYGAVMFMDNSIN